jgi:hypothetical protein
MIPPSVHEITPIINVQEFGRGPSLPSRPIYIPVGEDMLFRSTLDVNSSDICLSSPTPKSQVCWCDVSSCALQPADALVLVSTKQGDTAT